MAERTQNVTMYKYLDTEGLGKVWGRIKDNFSTKAELDTIQSDFSDNINDIYVAIDEIKGSLNDSVVSSVDDLTIQANAKKQISTSIGLDLDTVNQRIRLIALGKNATEENKVLSAISYSDLIMKDSFLKSVDIVVVTEGDDSGQTPGTYLKFSFNTDSGQNDIYVNVSEFINLYEGSTYVEVIDNKTIQLKYSELLNSFKGEFVTLTDFNASVTTLNDKIKANQDAINALLERLTPVETQVATNTTAIGEINTELSDVKETVESHTESIGSLDERITANQASINALLESLGVKVDKEEFDSLAGRVETAETDIDSLEQRITGLENAMNPDGELVTISISQVTDFAPMNEDDINNACKMTEEAI